MNAGKVISMMIFDLYRESSASADTASFFSAPDPTTSSLRRISSRYCTNNPISLSWKKLRSVDRRKRPCNAVCLKDISSLAAPINA